MSIKIDPKGPSTASNGTQPPSKPNFFQKWISSVSEGFSKETHSLAYCQKAWVQQTGTSPSTATQIFMRTCMDDCRAYQSDSRWSRLN